MSNTPKRGKCENGSSHFCDEHRAQVINYLKATGKQLDLLVSIGHYPKIEHERYINQSSRVSREDFS